MQFKSIILTIAASVALVQAAAVPAPAPTLITYDTCLTEASRLYETFGVDYYRYVPVASALFQCITCLMGSGAECGPNYLLHPGTTEDYAKDCYTKTIANCKINAANAPLVAPPKPPAA